MKKLLLLFAVLATAISASAENYILYTSSDGQVVMPMSGVDIFGAQIVSNTYEDGQGKIEFDGEVTMIGNSAFNSCSNLTSVKIPNSSTTIGVCAFAGCTSLTEMVVPNSVTEIGEMAFQECAGLTSVEIGNSVKKIRAQTFEDCSSLKSVVIGNSVREIEGHAFMRCTSLTSIEIPNSVTDVGWAFKDCTSLKSVVIGNSVTGIALETFSGCSSLTSVVIGSSVTYLGWMAFRDCINLKEIISLAVTPPSIDYMAFESSVVSNPETIVKVPAESVEAYKAAYSWSDFFNIEGIDPTAIEGVMADRKSSRKSFGLNGNEVGKGYKGILIQNGKKILRR